MKIKTFHAQSLPDAFRQIKEEMGDDALILSTREVAGSGPFPGLQPKQYEVTAAVDESEEASAPSDAAASLRQPAAKVELRPPSKPERSAGTRSASGSRNAHRKSSVPASGPKPVAVPENMGILQEEISHLKKMVFFLSQRHSLEREIPPSSPFFEAYQDLITSEADPWLALKAVDEAEDRLESRQVDTPAEAVYLTLAEWLSARPLSEDAPVRAVFFGPTGVGKTTTIAKLAARHCLELKRKVLLLTMDTYRIAAFEQLKTYADIIGIPCRAVQDPAQLREEIDRGDQFDTILIDTAGRSQRDLKDLKPWAEFFHQCQDVERIMVLSATTKMGDLVEAVDRFGIFGIDKATVTKIDETLTLGPVFNTLMRYKLPVACLTNGQNVPRDLLIPDEEMLAAMFSRNTTMEGVA